MMSYKDMTFCTDAEYCANHNDCPRYLSPKDIEEGLKWWGDGDFPISYSSFKDTCKEYVPLIRAAIP